MKKICLTFLLLCLGLVCSQQTKAGAIVTDSVRSEVLGGVWVKYNVYLPDGFAQSSQSYPVLYLLHGWSDDYTAWQKKGCSCLSLVPWRIRHRARSCRRPSC